MPMSLFKNNKNRNKVVNPYCSLVAADHHDLSEVCQAHQTWNLFWYIYLIFTTQSVN